MAAEVHISYPNTGTVPGGGGLFAWGTVTDLQAETAQASISPNHGTKAKVDSPSPCTWAFIFHDLHQGTTYTLTISADDMMGGPSTTQAVTFTIAGK